MYFMRPEIMSSWHTVIISNTHMYHQCLKYSYNKNLFIKYLCDEYIKHYPHK